MLPAIGSRRGDFWKLVLVTVVGGLVLNIVQFVWNAAADAAKSRYWREYSGSVEMLATRHPEVFRSMAK